MHVISHGSNIYLRPLKIKLLIAEKTKPQK